MAGPAPLSLVAHLAVQRRVLGALLIRELLTRYGRHNIGFLWLFVEPMMFTLGVTALWTATKSVHGSDLPIVAFALTGYSSVLLWRNMPGRCIGALEANLSLFYHRNIRALDIYLTRIAIEFSGATISFLVLGLVFILMGWLAPPEDVLTVVGGWLLIAWFGAALAMTLGALSHEFELVDKFWHPASYLLFPLSGAGFLVSGVPPAVREVVLWIPMVHGVEIIRDGFFGSKIEAIYDAGYAATFALVLSATALIAVRWAAGRVAPQ
ncbi:sugar ABC transporter permease [Porphyrobacter sp. HT-58-2]|uniref:ABC transporter permease n=1 Tax=Porphyrobacter sp. HT-58-2 TaxID=2023229 RepID=UPI000CDBBA92|nr:ABC transporter permease [Porphyrobacter sp. HT-58-2]AUX70456.1 sugar ABC transporter permease [Porphyrobacter sp. HT-58-2]